MAILERRHGTDPESPVLIVINANGKGRIIKLPQSPKRDENFLVNSNNKCFGINLKPGTIVIDVLK